MSYLWSLLSLCIKVQNEKCIWKIFVKYTQIRQSNTNTNISSGVFSNTNTNTNTYICVFKYKYKYKYVFDPSPGSNILNVSIYCISSFECVLSALIHNYVQSVIILDLGKLQLL